MNGKHHLGNNIAVTKYASMSNGTLANANALLSNGSAMNLTGVLGGASSNTNVNFMRSIINSTAKHSNSAVSRSNTGVAAGNSNRSYFSHVNGSSNNNNKPNASNTSMNMLMNASSSANNIFTDHDLSTYSLLPSETYKNNAAIVIKNATTKEKAMLAAHHHLTINNNSQEKTSRDSSKLVDSGVSNNVSEKSSYANLRKENLSSKENAPSSAKMSKEKQLQQFLLNQNNSIDANSIISSFYGNNSTISNVSHQAQQQPALAKKTINPSSSTNLTSGNGGHRGVLSSKQLNSQTANGKQISNSNLNASGVKKEDYLTSDGKSSF